MTEQQVRSLVGGIGLIIAALLASLAWHGTGVDIVFAAVIIWLLIDRAAIHNRVDEIDDEADKAKGPIAPAEPDEPWRFAPPIDLASLPPAPTVTVEELEAQQPEPATPPPPPPVVDQEPFDEWAAQQEAQFAEAMAAIERISLTAGAPAPPAPTPPPQSETPARTPGSAPPGP